VISYNEKLDNPVLLIRQLRHTFPVKPNCFHFAKLLTDIYPNSRIYYNSSHCITRIYNKYYDFNGIADPKGYLPLSDFYSPERLSDLFNKEFDKKYYLDRFYSDYQDGDVVKSHSTKFVNPTCDCVTTTENGNYILTCKNQLSIKNNLLIVKEAFFL